MSSLRWGLAGTGPITATTLADLRTVAGADVVSVASRTPATAERFAGEHGIGRTHSTFEGLFAAEDVDIVYLATPIGTHEDLATAALRAGKHVLVEKPLAATGEQARRLAAVAAREQRFCMEAMWMRFNPALRLVLDALAEGVIGQPRTVQAAFGFPAPPASNHWRPNGGGGLLDLGIYPLTLAHRVLGAPTSIAATGTVDRQGVDSSVAYCLTYGDDRMATGQTALTSVLGAGAAIGGTGGFIDLDPPFFATGTYRVHTPPFQHPRDVTVPIRGNGYTPMFEQVTAAITAGQLQHPDQTLADSIAVLDTIDAIRAQLTTGTERS